MSQPQLTILFCFMLGVLAGYAFAWLVFWWQWSKVAREQRRTMQLAWEEQVSRPRDVHLIRPKKLYDYEAEG